MTLSPSDIDKNIRRILRQSIGEDDHSDRTYYKTRAVFKYAEGPTPDINAVLEGMGLLRVAEAVIAGATLEQVGMQSDYQNAAQQRAWAAGRVSAFCDALLYAHKLMDDRAKIGELIRRKNAVIASQKADMTIAPRR